MYGHQQYLRHVNLTLFYGTPKTRERAKINTIRQTVPTAYYALCAFTSDKLSICNSTSQAIQIINECN